MHGAGGPLPQIQRQAPAPCPVLARARGPQAQAGGPPGGAAQSRERQQVRRAEEEETFRQRQRVFGLPRASAVNTDLVECSALQVSSSRGTPSSSPTCLELTTIRPFGRTPTASNQVPLS